jgi:HAD superfamily hydrolase (TIGR01509 family)
VTLPKGAEEVIQKIGNNFALGIVTSRVTENVFEAPALAALASHFKVVVGYQDTTNHKPHPEPLFFAAQKLGVKPAECVYIGDAPSDVQAGRAAGMKVIIYSKTEEPKADAWTSSFAKLPALVSSLAQTSQMARRQ